MMNKPHKAIFLDRDGVINKKRDDYVKNISELELIPHIGDSIKTLKDNGFSIIVVTNQSAINRKLTTHEAVNEIHAAIQAHLQSYGIQIDGFYYCPHMPNEYCNCRKPKSGLLLRAAYELNIDLKQSWMIGDSDSDIIAAKNVGCMAIKIQSNRGMDHIINQILNTCF